MTLLEGLARLARSALAVAGCSTNVSPDDRAKAVKMIGESIRILVQIREKLVEREGRAS